MNNDRPTDQLKEPDEKDIPENKELRISFLALGAGLGAALGAAFNNLAMGIAMGVAIGALLDGIRRGKKLS